MRILLVDDEYLALNLLEEFIGRLPGLTVVGKAKNPVQALEILEKERVDLLFLDIQMPIFSGTNLLRSLKRPPATIFTTAYSEHAVEAFELNVVDYLLKPFSFERFLQAINKAKEVVTKQNFASNSNKELDYIVVKVDGRLQKIILNELQFVEGLKEYVKFVCQGKSYVSLERMKNLEEMLPVSTFLRVHKSFIVNKNWVLSIEGNLLEVGKAKVPVSREKREEIVKLIFEQK